MNRSVWALVVDTIIVVVWANVTLTVMYRIGCFSWLVELLKEVMK